MLLLSEPDCSRGLKQAHRDRSAFLQKGEDPLLVRYKELQPHCWTYPPSDVKIQQLRAKNGFAFAGLDL